jgi:glycosyltransferase involved in cell wall biosynthesis
MAAKVDRKDEDYFRDRIEPMLAGGGVEYVGEVSEREKGELMGAARALLFPIDWPEPFGLVMVEAMSCGTPVIAWPGGAVREVVDEGVTGFVVESIGEAVSAVHRARDLDRASCRRRFEERFGAGRMAREYVSAYRQVIAARALSVAAAPGAASAAGRRPSLGEEA